jgi:mono/diheme cytochrome c family protein
MGRCWVRGSWFRLFGFWVLGFGVLSGAEARSQATSGSAVIPQTPTDDLRTLKAEGEVVYSRECASCHGGDGSGDGAGPALAGDASLTNTDRVVKQILDGSPDKGMEPFGKTLTDRDVAAVATYIRNAWENAHGIVKETDVARVRGAQKKEPR